MQNRFLFALAGFGTSAVLGLIVSVTPTPPEPTEDEKEAAQPCVDAYNLGLEVAPSVGHTVTIPKVTHADV